MKRIKLSLVFGCALALLAAQLVFAHEKRTVGKYDFRVGWNNEPAYANLPNSIQLTVTDTAAQKPVSRVDKTLQAEVLYGASSMVVPLTESDETPGMYLGPFVPTRVGTYIFHFSGQIEGQNVDEKFESGPNTFDDVQDIAAVEFPEKAPSPQDLASALGAAQDAASSARTIAFVGVAAGVLGLIAGGLALMRHKS